MTEPTAAPASPKLSPDATPLEVFFKGNRPLAAGALFVLLELVPAVGLVLSLRDGGGVWMVMALVLMGGALLPPLGVFLGRRWGYVLGQYVVWGTLVGLLLRVLQNGFAPVYLAPAVVLGMLLVSLSPPRAAGEPKKPEKKPESFGVWLKENIEAIVIAFIMALVIRCFCIEVFKIPSSSMEPTLLGDISENHSKGGCNFEKYHVSPGGDRIMVTKYFYSFSPIERYDVLVFKFPLNHAKNFIKRVVGLPGEYIKIHRGNLYVSKEEKGVYEIARRTLRTQDSVWIDPMKGTPGYLENKEEFDRKWEARTAHDRKSHADYRVQDGELSTQEAGGERSILFSHRTGWIDDGSGNPVDDLRLAFEVEITSPKGQIVAEIVNAYGKFELVLDTEGASWLSHYQPDKLGNISAKPTGQDLLKDVPLTMDRRYKVELLIFDGMAYARINQGVRGKLAFITNLNELADVEKDTVGRRISFAARGLSFRVKNLSVERDIFYRGRIEREKGLREDEAFHVHPGNYLMMGDNVANSHDSRAWVKRTFVLRDGRKIVCESQQVMDGYSQFTKKLAEKLGITEPLKYTIDGDIDGNEVPILESQFDHEEESVPAREVDEKYIVGKALWIWWPQGRWFHLIR
jgi:signal peptidase I